ncbi:MAG: LptF/LptG family permease [Planctomycetota bacterium]|nr:LptF/LptG family permease [Planctomycetota bacterium]
MPDHIAAAKDAWSQRVKARPAPFKLRLRKWLPFGLRRVDWYYTGSFFRVFLLILLALAALVAIGDLFQRFDDFVILAREEEPDFHAVAGLFASFYATYVPALIFQFMFPLTMLLAAGITVTSSFAGPRGNNEYTVLRAVGVPVKRTLLPLLLPTLFISAGFLSGRDYFLPAMVRTSTAIINRLKSRRSAPVNVSVVGDDMFQTAAMGWFSHEREAYNLILEVRDLERFQRGDVSLGDNDFIAYRTARARLEPSPQGDGWQWTPVENGEKQTFTRFSRRTEKWIEPIPTKITSAMIERQTVGDSVCTWEDLRILAEDYSVARFEMHWRLADPIACCLLVMGGFGLCMGRMLRGRGVSYIHTVATCICCAGLFYGLRLLGRSLWESGSVSPLGGVWYPLAGAFVLASVILIWMER